MESDEDEKLVQTGSAITMEKYRHEFLSFAGSLKQYLQAGDEEAIRNILTYYFSKYPEEREFLISLSSVFHHQLGNFSLTQFSISLFLDTIDHIRRIGADYYKIPRVLGRLPTNDFFELIDGLISIKCLLELGVLKHKPLLVMKVNGKNFSNNISECLLACVDIVSDDAEIKRAREMHFFNPLSFQFFRFSKTVFGSSEVLFNGIYPKLLEHNISPAVFRTFKEKLKWDSTILKKYSVKPNDKFIILYISSRFAQKLTDLHGEEVDLQEIYRPLIDYFLSLKIKVIYFGDLECSVHVDSPNFIDIEAASERVSTEQKLSLLSQTLFYVGSNSGLYKFCNALGVPSLLTHAFPIEIRGNTLANLNKFINLGSETLCSIEELRQSNLCKLTSVSGLKERGIKVAYPSADEMLKSGMEMMERFNVKGRIERSTESNPELDRVCIWGNVTRSFQSVI